MKKMRLPQLRNLQPKLIVAFALILMIPSIIIGASASLSAKSAIEDELLSSIEENLNILNLSIDNAIQPKIEDVGNFLEKFQATNLHKENKNELLMSSTSF